MEGPPPGRSAKRATESSAAQREQAGAAERAEPNEQASKRGRESRREGAAAGGQGAPTPPRLETTLLYTFVQVYNAQAVEIPLPYYLTATDTHRYTN